MIAFGPRAGKWVRRIGSGYGYEGETPRSRGRWIVEMNGFTLHAGVEIRAQRRDELERLVRYMARGPIANDRITIRPDGRIEYSLKNRFSDGTTAILLDPVEFLEKISAIISPPRVNHLRYGGILAPASKLRSLVVPVPKKTDCERSRGTCHPDCGGQDQPRDRYLWSDLLKRVYGFDVKVCGWCQGTVYIVSAITQPDVIRKILVHIGADPDPPPRGRAARQKQLGFSEYD